MDPYSSGLILLCTSIVMLGAYAWSSPVPVTEAEQSQWLCQLIPLPKEIRIQSKVHVDAGGVHIRVREGAGEIERFAAQEIIALFQAKSVTTPSQRTGLFQIVLGVCDEQGRTAGLTVPGAERLANLPNCEQAYRIAPVDSATLVLTALSEQGVYYAAQTLRHLIEHQFNEGKVILPLASVTDWPDLAERGEWGGSAVNDIAWFSQYKLNLVEAHASLSVDAAGKGVATISQDLLDEARVRAVKVVPIITHLDYLQGSGVSRRFPELKGVGESARPRTDTETLCFSNPKMTEILADWMECLATQKGVTDINVWLSEYHGQCGCPQCQEALKKGLPQHALETLAVKRALNRARKKFPHLRARVLLTQGSYPVNDKVLGVAPPELGVTYYCGVGPPVSSYSSSRDHMIYPLLAEYAQRGNWLGVYPQFTASYGAVSPWSCPQFIKFRMTEFVDKGLKCVCGYTVPENRLHDFNVTAAAEWSWNAHGRSEREFAKAWATRRGYKEPERVAEWALLLGPVGWDVYGQGTAAAPYTGYFLRAANNITNRTKPMLGEALWRYFPNEKHFEEDLQACQKALEIATQLDAPLLITETQVIYSYVKMAKELFTIASLRADTGPVSEEVRKRLQEAMCRLGAAGLENVNALQEWEKASGAPITAPRFRATLRATETTVAEVAAALAPLGIRDPSKPYRRILIGDWASEKFSGKGTIRLQWEVTQHVSAPGRYQIEFRYTSGRDGLPIQRVVLASSLKDRSQELMELSKDEHSGFAGHQSRGHVYFVNLPTYDPMRRLFIIADVTAVSSSRGEVWMKYAERPPASFVVNP